MQRGTKSNPADKAFIQNIQSRAVAVENQLYFEIGGEVYKGTNKNRLKNYTREYSVDITLVEHTETIEDHGNRIKDLETEAERLEATKADKCFAIAMSLVLG